MQAAQSSETPRPLTRLTEEETMFQSTVRQFAREQVGPWVREMDAAGLFRKELIRRERLARDLEIARDIQRYILPPQCPRLGEYDMAVEYHPAREVVIETTEPCYTIDGEVFPTREQRFELRLGPPLQVATLAGPLLRRLLAVDPRVPRRAPARRVG